MYQLNKPYSKQELAEEVFNIKPRTLSNNLKMYMHHLEEYFEVKVIPNGRWEKYMLVKELKPWKTYGEVFAEESKKTIEDYKNAAKEVLEKEPRNTISNVASEIRHNKEIRKYNHAEYTGRRYTGKVMNTYFTAENAAWCEKLPNGKYRVCSEEEVSVLRDLRYEYRNQPGKEDQLFELYNQKRNNEVTDEELNKRLDEIYGTYYDKVIDEFKKNFGFFPIWVKEWK